MILGYYIGYRLADSIDDAYQFKTTHASQNNTFESTYLTNLRRQTRYLIVVKAFNRAGVGPPSEELIAQTLETGELYTILPFTVVQSASSAHLVVSCTHPFLHLLTHSQPSLNPLMPVTSSLINGLKGSYYPRPCNAPVKQRGRRKLAGASLELSRRLT